MRRSARTATRIVPVAAMVALTSLLTPSGSASACSCDGRTPAVLDAIGQVDIAFVGRLDSTEEIDATEFDGSPEYFDTRYELIVEHPVKGVEADDRVVMFGDVSGGSSCGTSELAPGRERYAVLSTDNSGVFVADSTPPCSELPSVEELLAADLTLPATSPGPVSLVAVGRVGEAELISYGADGRPVGYGDLPWSVGEPVVCPGSERMAQVEQDPVDGSATLIVRDLSTLDVIERRDLSTADRTDSSSDHLDDFLAGGAALDCRSPDGQDVSALLSWERTDREQTMLISFRRDGDVEITMHGRVSQARHDPSTDDAIGVRAGALVRIAANGESGDSVIAQLTDEDGLGPVFVEPDTSNGWWVGLGPEGEYGIADSLQILVNVDADGVVEQWPVDGDVAYISSVGFDGDRLDGDGFSIPLPAPGSSTGGVAVTVERTDDDVYQFDLGDGRVVRPASDENSSTFDLIDSDGAVTPLEHLAEVRWAVAVTDGPTVEPDAIVLDLSAERVESDWITPNGLAATDRQQSVVIEPNTTGPSTSASDDSETNDAATNDEDPTGLSASSDVDDTGEDDETGAGVTIVAVIVLVGGGLATAALLVRRRSRRS